MIKAEITIGTCYGDATIPVEVLGSGPFQGTVWVRALDGLHPFTRMSNGGPTQDDTSIVHIPNLHDVHILSDYPETLISASEQPPEIDQPVPVPALNVPLDWFLESAYTERAKRPERGAWCEDRTGSE